MDIVLYYVGDGAWVAGVPASNLTQADIDEVGRNYGYSYEDIVALDNNGAPLYSTEAPPTE